MTTNGTPKRRIRPNALAERRTTTPVFELLSISLSASTPESNVSKPKRKRSERGKRTKENLPLLRERLRRRS